MSNNTKPTLAINVASIKRTRKRIEIAWTQGDAAFDLKERDNPLPSFVAALDALVPLVGTICHLPEDYTATNCRVTGVILGEQDGVETVALVARKGLDDASKEFVFKTPARLLAHPTEEGSYTPPLTGKEAEAVAEAIEQAKMYIRGERAQGQIAFEDEDGDGDDGDNSDTAENNPDQEDLPLAAPEMAHNRKRRGKRKGEADVIDISTAG